VDNTRLAIAGAAFSFPKKFTGWGLLKGGPFLIIGNSQWGMVSSICEIADV
jgi:hypothetical protein